MKIQTIKLEKIKPYENNPRNNDSAVDKIVESIKEFGFQNPIILDKNYTIIAGHTRYKAAQKLNLDEVPCIVDDTLTDEKVKAYRIADNKLAELSSWNYDSLKLELQGLNDADFNIDCLGFSDFELNNILQSFDYDRSDMDPTDEDDTDEIDLKNFDRAITGTFKTISFACKDEDEERWLADKFGLTFPLRCSYAVAKVRGTEEEGE